MRLIVILMLAGSALSQPATAQAPQPAPAQAPAVQAPADTTGAIPAPQRVGSMSELMVDIIYPASDAIFYVTTREPANDVEWNALRGKALMVAESANLLMMPGRARDQDRWMADAKLLLEAGTAAFRAARRKDLKALEDLNDQLYQSCTTCHMHYRANYGRRPAPEPQTPR
jgi:hypothetical protein